MAKDLKKLKQEADKEVDELGLSEIISRSSSLSKLISAASLLLTIWSIMPGNYHFIEMAIFIIVTYGTYEIMRSSVSHEIYFAKKRKLRIKNKREDEPSVLPQVIVGLILGGITGIIIDADISILTTSVWEYALLGALIGGLLMGVYAEYSQYY